MTGDTCQVNISYISVSEILIKMTSRNMFELEDKQFAQYRVIT